MTDLINLTLSEAKDGLRNKKFSAKELTIRYIRELENKRHLNAYITETPEKALHMASESDRKIAEGSIRKLEGIPIAIKDNYCTRGILTTAASRMLSNFIPPYESTVTDHLWRDGAVLLGKANMDEFALGSDNTSSYFGPVESPWRSKNTPEEKLTPGGSSGGSAAIVSAKMALAATGSDTGGSIRQPASFTGIVGLKPTYGRCSRYGIVAFASSLDQAGPMTRTVRDSAILLESMAGYDPKDSTSVNCPVPVYESYIGQSIKGIRIGVPSSLTQELENNNSDLYHTWMYAIDILRDSGAIIVDIQLPHIKYALPTYHIITSAELSSNLARYDGIRYGMRENEELIEDVYKTTRSRNFGYEVKKRLLLGTFVLSAESFRLYYTQAKKVRTCIIHDFQEAWKVCDVVSTPTTTQTAFALNTHTVNVVESYLTDTFSSPANLAGLPAISVPSGFSNDNLPIGMQLIGRPFDESTILQCAYIIEKSAQKTPS